MHKRNKAAEYRTTVESKDTGICSFGMFRARKDTGSVAQQIRATIIARLLPVMRSKETGMGIFDFSSGISRLGGIVGTGKYLVEK